MIDSLDAIPETERNTLLVHFLNRWKGQVSSEEPDQAKEFCKEPFVYSIRMFWIGRSDKLNGDSVQLFDWLSRHALHESAAYKGIKPAEILIDKFVVDPGAKQMFEDMWSLYLKHPACDLKNPEQQSLIDCVTSFFRR